MGKLIKPIGPVGVIPEGLSCEKLEGQTTYFLMLFNFVIGLRMRPGDIRLTYLKREVLNENSTAA